MILIKRHGFDNMENRDAEYETIMGYAVTEEEANKYIAEKLKTETKYKGWDGNTYPFYSKTVIYEVGDKKSNEEILESIKEKVEELTSKAVYNFKQMSADELLSHVSYSIYSHRGKIPFAKVEVHVSCINDTLIPAMKKESCLFIHDTDYETIEEGHTNKTVISRFGAIPVTFFGEYNPNGEMYIKTIQFTMSSDSEVIEIKTLKEDES